MDVVNGGQLRTGPGSSVAEVQTRMLTSLQTVCIDVRHHATRTLDHDSACCCAACDIWHRI